MPHCAISLVRTEGRHVPSHADHRGQQLRTQPVRFLGEYVLMAGIFLPCRGTASSQLCSRAPWMDMFMHLPEHTYVKEEQEKS